MPLDPIFEAPVPVQIHLAAVAAALVLGVLVLAMPKGTPRHRWAGRAWGAAMAAAAIVTFWIRREGGVFGYSAIHLISIFVLVQLVVGVMRIRRGDVAAHRATMIGLMVGGIGFAGALAFAPGRLMHALVFG